MTRVVALSPTEFNGDVLSIDVADLLQARTKRSQEMGVCLSGAAADISDRPDGLLSLRARREWPSGRAAEQGNELPPSHAWCPPASTAGSVYLTVSLLQSRLQVLGMALNCSELMPVVGPLMSALGQNRTSGGRSGHVRFTPGSGHPPAGAGMSAKCQSRTSATFFIGPPIRTAKGNVASPARTRGSIARSLSRRSAQRIDSFGSRSSKKQKAASRQRSGV